MWTSYFCICVLNNTKTHAAKFAESQTLTSLPILAFMWASLATCTTDDASFIFQRMLLFPPSRHSQIQSERWSLWLGVHSLWKRCVCTSGNEVWQAEICAAAEIYKQGSCCWPLVRCMCRIERQNVTFLITCKLCSSADEYERGGRWGRERKHTRFWWNP